MLDQVANFIKVQASQGYDHTATAITLKAGQGAKLPDPASGAYNLVWWNVTNYADPSDDPYVQIIRVTGKTGDVLTIVQGQEGTSANDMNMAGKTYQLILGITAKMIADIQTALGSIPSSCVASFNARTGSITLLSADVTGALGFTPYNASNPAGYISGASVSAYETDPLSLHIDQTTPQTVINGAPILAGGLEVGNTGSLGVSGTANAYMDSSGNGYFQGELDIGSTGNLGISGIANAYIDSTGSPTFLNGLFNIQNLYGNTLMNLVANPGSSAGALVTLTGNGGYQWVIQGGGANSGTTGFSIGQISNTYAFWAQNNGNVLIGPITSSGGFPNFSDNGFGTQVVNSDLDIADVTGTFGLVLWDSALSQNVRYQSVSGELVGTPI